MGVLDGNPKDQPLHYGEVFQLWALSLAAKGMISGYQTLLNHAGDKDLISLIGDIMDQAKQEEKECDKLLIDNEIVPGPSLPEKPKARLEDIPVGARFSDMEIAAMITADSSIGLVACSQAMGMSIREDIGALFAKYHASKTALGMRILKLNKNKGWLIPPPLQLHKSELVEV